MVLFFQLINYTKQMISANLHLSNEFAILFIVIIIIFLICKLLDVNFSHHHTKTKLTSVDKPSNNIRQETINTVKKTFWQKGKGFNIPIIICFVLFLVALLCIAIYNSKLAQFEHSPCEATLEYLQNHKVINAEFKHSFLSPKQLEECNLQFNDSQHMNKDKMK